MWQQVVLLEHADPKEAVQKSKEKREKILGTCLECKGKIYDDMIKLEGGKVARHLECHKCARCKDGLGSSSYYLDNNKTVCENCVQKQLSNLSISSGPPSSAAAPPKQTSLGTCATCSKGISQKVVEAQGKKYCNGCLKCLKCSRSISGGDAFFNRENGVICEDCGS